MKIVIASDSFKESMSAKVACEAIEEGIRAVEPDSVCIKVPMADGGEGTLVSVCDALQGTITLIDSYDVFYNPIQMPIGICNDLIVIESASCIGLDLIPLKKRNVWKASTYGLGIAIKRALDFGPKKIMICLGGSATNDMGLGMLQALGTTFLDKNNDEVDPLPIHMQDIVKIDNCGLDHRLQDVEIVAACDVQNPLCGTNGASYVFGPQKGASIADVSQLDKNLEYIGQLASRLLQLDILNIPGGGAAGGIGSVLHGFLVAKLQPGVEIVKEVVRLEEQLKDADLVITGEGSLDEQTLHGKTCYGVLRSAKKFDLPVLAFAGVVKPGAKILYEHGLTAFFPIVHEVKPTPELLASGVTNLTNTVENVFRLRNMIRSQK